MRIDELLRQGRTWSFEFFPPKTPTGEREFNAAVSELSALSPSYVSVTYGALGGVRHLTRDVVLRVNAEHDYPAMPHLTCVGHTRAELGELLRTYRDGGVQNILALAGDPIDSPTPGDFRYATELVELIRETGEFSVAVAAFPEGHPRSRDLVADRMRLADKLAIADFGLTQFFFDVDSYRRMVDDLDARGCDTPVIPGVMPFVSVPGTYRMAQMNGTSLPSALRERMELVSGDPEATRRLGVEVATELVSELLDLGVPGIHLYAMNRAASIREIYANLGLRPTVT